MLAIQKLSHPLIACLALTGISSAQTTIPGSALVYRSTGASAGNAWTLDRDGYVGTYITLDAPGNVTIGVNADGTPSGGISPHVSVAIADQVRGFNVASGNYNSTFALPAGTFFVRTQLDNDLAITPRQVKINSVTVAGANIANSATTANALAASDTYITNYRKGNATINLSALNLPAGSQVGVSMKRVAFNWGTAIPGHSASDVNSYLGNGGTAKQTNFQARLNQNFNAVVPENAAKWGANEATRNVVTMQATDQILGYAQSHNMKARLHNMIWDSPEAEPGWVNELKADQNTASLRAAISSRAGYYGPRMAQVNEVDVYNESRYGQHFYGSDSNWNLLGASGIANVYHEVKQTLGSQAKLFVNDFDGLDWNDPDPKWGTKGYFRHIEELRQAGIAAGYGEVIGGIGTQNYVSTHSPSDVIASYQNYAVTGLAQSTTEFGVWPGTTPDAATVLKDNMRLQFGNPLGTGFFMWGFHLENGGGLFAPGAAFYTVNTSNWNNWTITEAGKAWQDQLGIQDWDGNTSNGWNTQLSKPLTANGTISFDGYYGDYTITVGGQTYDLTLAKGTTNYTIGGLPGDFTSNGVVDAADYALWRKRGMSAAQYALWRANFGRAPMAMAGEATPEPSTFVLLFEVALGGVICRRQRAPA